jgi:hypothetical protein
MQEQDQRRLGIADGTGMQIDAVRPHFGVLHVHSSNVQVPPSLPKSHARVEARK